MGFGSHWHLSGSFGDTVGCNDRATLSARTFERSNRCVTAYRIADLADVAWGWFIWISSIGSVLRRLVWTFLDPVLQVSYGSARPQAADPWFLTYTTDISFRYWSFIYNQLSRVMRSVSIPDFAFFVKESSKTSSSSSAVLFFPFVLSCSATKPNGLGVAFAGRTGRGVVSV